MTTDVNVWMVTMELNVSNKMTATLATIVPMGQHMLMGAMSTHVTVLMVTMETIVRNKITATLVTIVRMEELALIRMATTLATAHHLGLKCTVNVSKNDMRFKKSDWWNILKEYPLLYLSVTPFLSVQIYPTLTFSQYQLDVHFFASLYN